MHDQVPGSKANIVAGAPTMLTQQSWCKKQEPVENRMREQELDKDFLASFIIQEMCLCIRKTIVRRPQEEGYLCVLVHCLNHMKIRGLTLEQQVLAS